MIEHERESEIALQLRQFVQSEVMRDNEAVELQEPLFETGRVDSLGLLQIVEHIGREFGVDLLQRGRPADLRTLATLAQAILREGGAA
jgi:acyl carrier protein